MKAGLAPSVRAAARPRAPTGPPAPRVQGHQPPPERLVRQRELNRLVDAAGTVGQGRLQRVRPVRRQDEEHVRLFPQPVHLVEQPVEHHFIAGVGARRRLRAIRSASSITTRAGCSSRASAMYCGSTPAPSAVISSVVWPASRPAR